MKQRQLLGFKPAESLGSAGQVDQECLSMRDWDQLDRRAWSVWIEQVSLLPCLLKVSCVMKHSKLFSLQVSEFPNHAKLAIFWSRTSLN
jgi:hypothetical protein